METSIEAGELSRLREQLRVLGHATQAFAAATDDFPLLLETIASNLADVIGDACALFLLSDDGSSLSLSTLSSSDAQFVRECRAVLGVPMPVAARPTWQRVLVTGEPLLVPKISLDVYAADSAPVYVDLIARTGLHSSLVVPLRVHGRSIGLLVQSRFRASSLAYDEADCDLARIVADQASLAIGSARAYAAERAARAAEALAAANVEHMRERAQLAALVDASDDAIIGKTLEGVVTSWNRGAQKMFGYTPEEILGKSIGLLIPPGRESEETEILEEVAHGEGRSFETVRRRKDGRHVDVAVTISPLRDASGRVIGVSKIARDITERKRAQEMAARLKDAALTERLRTVTDLAQVGMVIVGGDRRYRYANRSYAEMLRLPSPDIVGQRVADVLPTVYDSQIRPRLDRAFHGERVAYELLLPAVTGAHEERCYAVSYEPSTDAGEPTVVVVIVDMTDRKRIVEALALHEEQLSLFIAHSPVALAMFDREMRYVAASHRWYSDYGLPDADLAGRSHYDVLPTIPEGWKEAHRRALEGAVERSDEDSFVLPDGRTTWLRWEIRPWRTPRGDIGGIVIFTEDITMRKEADRALRESEERFREIAENIRDVFWVTDATRTRLLYVSPAYEAIWGRSRERVYSSVDDWVEAIHPEDRERVRVAAASRPASEAYQETYRIVATGGKIRWIHHRSFPIRGPNGEVLRFVGLASDITEERTLADQFRQAQKMEAVGRLAGGVAHDFNNILSVILSYSTMLAEGMKPTDPVAEDLEEIRKAAGRAADLTRQLLMFSRQQVVEPRVLDLNDLLVSMGKMLQRVLGEDIDLVSEPTPLLGRIKADPSSVEQVVMNLVVNARDAMPTGGQLTIETGNVDLDESYTREHPGSSPGPHVMLAVTDTGIGMDQATQTRIFEPFFTTKEAGKGTGLGLSTVFGIAQQCGGSVWVYSELGKGTTFKVYFPRVEGAADRAPATLAPVTLRGSETILLVEDQEQVRVVAQGILTRNGYRVIVAQNAGEALLLCEKHPATIHLLLTDVVMPRMSGAELAKRLASTRSEMRVLCMSGYTDDSVVRHGVLESGMAFLQKPFTPESLTRKVREVLNVASKEPPSPR